MTFDPTVILDTPMFENDARALTVRHYLKKLLSTLLTEQECFSGKHPFGNSSWEYDLIGPLVKAGHVEGEMDSEEPDVVVTYDSDDFQTKIQAAIWSLS